MANHRMSNNGISMDAGSADIHLKMCKKVAQLTKVIYVLNTRLDENETLVNQLQLEHESELDRVRSETTDKLKMYKSVVDQLSASERKAAELDECLHVQKRHEVEALARFESFKQEANERESLLKDEYSARLLDLGSQVLKIKHQLEEKIAQLDKLSTERSADKDRLNNATEIERRYKDEISSLRDRNSNLQHSIDKMKEDNTNLMENSQSEFREKENDLNDKISRLEKEVEEAKRRSHQQIQMTQSELMENHKKEVQSLRDQVEKLKKSASVQDEQYQIRINDLVQRLATSDALAEELRAEISRQGEMLANKNSNSSDLQMQLMEASAKNNSLVEETHRLEGEVTKLSKNCAELSRDVLQKSEDLSSAQSLNLQLESRSNDLKRDLDATKNALAAAEAKIKQTSASNSKLESELTARLSETEAELAETRRENAKLIANHANQLSLLTDEHNRKINELTGSHENEMLILRSHLEEELSKERLASEEKLGKLSKDLLGQGESLRNQFESEKALLVNNFESEIEVLKNELEDRQAKLRNLEEVNKKQSDELAALINQQHASSSEAKNALSNLEDIKRKLNAVEEHNKKIEAENTEMRSRHPVELENMRKRHGEEMISAVARIEAEWAEKLKNELNAVRRSMLGESEQKFQNTFDTLQKQKEAEIQAVKDGWEKKTAELLKELSNARKKFSAAESEFASEKARIRSEYDDQIGKLREELNGQIDMLKEEIKTLKNISDEEMTALLAQKEKALKETEERMKQENLEAMQAQTVAHRTVTDSLTRQHEMEKARALEEAARQYSLELAEVRDALAKKHLTEMEQAVRFHDAQAAAVKQELEKVVELTRNQERDYEARLEEMKRQLKQRDQKVSTLEDSVATWEQKSNALVKELENINLEAARARDQFMAEMRTREEEVLSNAANEMEQMRRDARIQQQSMVEEFSKAQQLLKDKISSLQDMYGELEEKFRHRESRDEDLSLIEELKDRLRIKANELSQVLHEKRGLEMELVNRERNFNKVFSSAPQVGVIDPIASSMKTRKSSIDSGKNARTQSGGGSDVSSISGGILQVKTNKGPLNVRNTSQAWTSSNISSSTHHQQQQRFLDPLPNSPPVRDDPINPLKPLPPAPKLISRI